MSLVEKAFNIDVDNKALAKAIYKKAFRQLAETFGNWDVADAHTQLSVEFGELWIMYAERGNFNLAAARRANNAFNYANIVLGGRGKILNTAKEILGMERYSEAKILWIEEHLNDFDTLLTYA